LILKTYIKPLIVDYNAGRGIVPAAIAAAPLTVTFGVSLAQAAAAAAVAALGGAAVGAAVARKGSKIITTEFISALTERKDFAFA